MRDIEPLGYFGGFLFKEGSGFRVVQHLLVEGFQLSQGFFGRNSCLRSYGFQSLFHPTKVRQKSEVGPCLNLSCAGDSILLSMSWEKVLSRIRRREERRSARYSWGVLLGWLLLWTLAVGSFWAKRLSDLPEMTEEETWVALASFFPIDL